MPAHKQWWEWIVYALGTLGGVKSVSDLVQQWIFTKPKLRGEVLEKRWGATIHAAQRGEDDYSLLLFARVSNQHPTKTTVKEWRIELNFSDRKLNRTVNSTRLGDYWGAYRDEFLPNDTSTFDPNIVFEHNVIHKGWLRFLVRMDTDPISFKLLATDASNTKHRVAAGALNPDQGLQ